MYKYLLIGLLVGYLGCGAARNHFNHVRNTRYAGCDATFTSKFDTMDLNSLEKTVAEYHSCLNMAEFTTFEKAVILYWEY